MSQALEITPASLEYSEAVVNSARQQTSSYCSLRPTTPRELGPDVHPERAALILLMADKWVNGTVLHYYFFDKPTDGRNVVLTDGSSRFLPWTTTSEEKDVVRKGFETWMNVGIGMRFVEVATREEADVRIGFDRFDGSWSYIGREILNQSRDDRTMNFGWDLTRRPQEIDTAIHEIGHTLGFPHEHQNPNSGIVWNEDAVYAALSQPPNSWDRQKTFFNIIRKISPDTVQGSNWDPNSIMHYPFEAGLIDKPVQYRNGLTPAGGLSQRDLTWVKTFYPPLTDAALVELKPGVSEKLSITPGQQRDLLIKPNATRKYDIATFGTSDTVMVLFDDVNGELHRLAADDDSGEDRNAHITLRLVKGRNYTLHVRLYYAERAGETAVMLW